MTEHEIERMVVRLVGDGSSYQKMMTDAAKQTTEAARTIDQAGTRIESLKTSLNSFASAAVGALGTLGLASSLHGAFGAFSDFERQQIRVKASIEASGQAVDTVLPKYNELARIISANTLTSKAETFSLIQQAQNMGKSGDALERLVKNSIAFGAATGQSAESAFHLALAFEQGDQQFLKFALGLRHAHGDIDVMGIANQRLAAGFKVLSEENKTASGQVERMKRTFYDLNIEIGGMIATGIRPLLDFTGGLVAQFKALDPETRKTVAGIILGTLAFIALGPAISTASFLLRALGLDFILTTVKQTIMLTTSIVLWGAWKLAVLAATLTMWSYNLAVAAATLATTGFTASILVATAALVLIPATIVAITGGIFVLAAAIVGTVNTAQSLVGIFLQVPQLLGPINRVKAAFMDWVDIFKDIIRAAKVDMPLAWDLVKAASNVAIAEVAQSWPRLWQFMRSGFDAVGAYVAKVLPAYMEEAARGMAGKIAKAAGAPDWVLKQMQADWDAAIQARVVAQGKAGFDLAKDLKKALDDVNKAQPDSPELAAAKARLEELRRVALPEAERKALEQRKADEDAWKNLTNAQAGGIKNVTAAVKELDFVLRGSAEAKARVTDYQEKLWASLQAGAARGGGGGQPAGAGAPALAGPPPVINNNFPPGDNREQLAPLIRRTNQLLEQMAQKAGINVPLQPLNLPQL